MKASVGTRRAKMLVTVASVRDWTAARYAFQAPMYNECAASRVEEEYPDSTGEKRNRCAEGAPHYFGTLGEEKNQDKYGCNSGEE